MKPAGPDEAWSLKQRLRGRYPVGPRLPNGEPEISREALGEAIYLALYEHQGAVWAANESKGVWYDAADRLRAILNLAPVAKGAGAEPGAGWVYNSPDTGMEYSTEHPLESGEIPDATDVRRSTFFEDWMFGEIGRLDAKVRELVVNLAPVGGRGAVSAPDRAFVRHLIREMRSAIADDPNDATITTGPLDPDILERVLNVALGAQEQGGIK